MLKQHYLYWVPISRQIDDGIYELDIISNTYESLREHNNIIYYELIINLQLLMDWDKLQNDPKNIGHCVCPLNNDCKIK